jgi:hypothetical protein
MSAFLTNNFWMYDNNESVTITIMMWENWKYLLYSYLSKDF